MMLIMIYSMAVGRSFHRKRSTEISSTLFALRSFASAGTLIILCHGLV